MAITASEARKNLFPLIEKVNDDRTPIEIFGRYGRTHHGRTGRIQHLALNCGTYLLTM